MDTTALLGYHANKTNNSRVTLEVVFYDFVGVYSLEISSTNAQRTDAEEVKTT